MKAAHHPTAAATDISASLLQAARRLVRDLAPLRFGPPVVCVYNPLVYAGELYARYLRRYGSTPKRAVFLGMNPGPFGMVQTGIPFGEVHAVREWLLLSGPVHKPRRQHPLRPVAGLDCRRVEVSGQRLWKLFADRFGTPANFFAEHIVLNYCPLAFIEASGRNRTPDKLPPSERAPLFAACDRHLRAVVDVLKPEWVVGIGDFALQRAQAVFPPGSLELGRVLHPSPANPAANRDWAAMATRQLVDLGVWSTGAELQRPVRRTRPAR